MPETDGVFLSHPASITKPINGMSCAKRPTAHGVYQETGLLQLGRWRSIAGCTTVHMRLERDCRTTQVFASSVERSVRRSPTLRGIEKYVSLGQVDCFVRHGPRISVWGSTWRNQSHVLISRSLKALPISLFPCLVFGTGSCQNAPLSRYFCFELRFQGR